MTSGQLTRTAPSAAWRGFWQSLVVLLLFVQVAAAADRCLPERLSGARATLADMVAQGHHALDVHCPSALGPADQAPAPEAKRLVADVGVPLAKPWNEAPDVAGPQPATYPPVRAGPSIRLQFRNLRL